MPTVLSRLTALTAAVAALAALPLAAHADGADDAPDCTSGMAASTTDERKDTPRSLSVAGLTAEGQLVCFNERKPQRVRVLGTIAGHQFGETRLIGIDYRPQDGLLYGVGNLGGLYRVDTATAGLMAVGRLSVTPAGERFGVDFNPAANALRIVSDSGQNLRQSFANLGTANPLAATANDTALNNGAGAAAAPVLGVVAAGYTNNDVGANATGTTLFVIQGTTGQVALQSPANSGQVVPTGSLGVAGPLAAVGFDIYSQLRDGVTVAQRALATVPVNGQTELHRVDLLTGKASAVGRVGAAVVDIAIPLNQP